MNSVLLETLKEYNCIITALAGVPTPDYKALTNQGHVSFSVYRQRNLLQ